MEDDDNNDALDAELIALLSDTSIWDEPSDSLEDRVVASIAQERRVVVPMVRRRRAWPGRVAAAAIGAAAAAAVVLVVAPRNNEQKADARVEVVGTELAPNVSGRADITKLTSGFRIKFSVTGLPRREGGEFYEGWLKNCDGTGLVPIGTFHELDDATGWAGVSIDEFPLLTVTRETVAPPKDAAQGSSGEVVASAKLGPCPT
jgi:hypothetical protein